MAWTHSLLASVLPSCLPATGVKRTSTWTWEKTQRHGPVNYFCKLSPSPRRLRPTPSRRGPSFSLFFSDDHHSNFDVYKKASLTKLDTSIPLPDLQSFLSRLRCSVTFCIPDGLAWPGLSAYFIFASVQESSYYCTLMLTKRFILLRFSVIATGYPETWNENDNNDVP